MFTVEVVPVFILSDWSLGDGMNPSIHRISNTHDAVHVDGYIFLDLTTAQGCFYLWKGTQPHNTGRMSLKVKTLYLFSNMVLVSAVVFGRFTSVCICQIWTNKLICVWHWRRFDTFFPVHGFDRHLLQLHVDFFHKFLKKLLRWVHFVDFGRKNRVTLVSR